MRTQEPAEYGPGEAMPGPPGALLLDRMLLAVRRARLRQDEEHGILRDYRDGTCGSRYHGPAPSSDRQALMEAKRALDDAKRAGLHSWRHFLELSAAEVYAEANERRLKGLLIEHAAMACAWAEGIDIRHDDRRIAIEQRAREVVNGKLVRMRLTWWERLRNWLRK